ncbi:MAG: hypothetical protein KatS3mg085_685 [Candidatus Dojkabacteria bacterium]|nr:MAG: hypothetical protein KatS3mg085_685 [Candidatus Dojkabacteria bacterium]
MKNSFERKILFGLSVFLFIFTLLPIIAPIAAYLNLNFIADPIYWIYQWFCHQRPWRSYHLFDYQLAMDARMMLMFGSMAIASLLIYIKNLKPLKPFTAVIFAVIFIIPLGMDGVIQAIAEMTSYGGSGLPFYESTNLMRSITGTLFGIGVAFAMFPYLNSFNQFISPIIYIKPIIWTFVFSILFMCFIVFSWNISSKVYKPSHLLFDAKARFPGYNYEVTTSAGHSTIERVFNVDDKKLYLERARHFEKKEYIE